MDFVKMHGLGNDFVVVEAFDHDLDEPAELARRMCDRHFGIGADGLLLLEASERADMKMRVINSDGSEAQMCGNGIRCVARYAWDHKLVEKPKSRIETAAGIIEPELIFEGDRITAVRVNMGPPRLERAQIPMKGPAKEKVVREAVSVEGGLRAGDTNATTRFQVTGVSMGNPHAIILLQDTPWPDDLDRFPLATWGPRISALPVFPEGANITVVQVMGDGDLRARVWERGAGETLACGTAACATLVATHLSALSRRKARVRLPGGPVDIEWRQDGNVYMTGPAEEVFKGTWLL